MEVLLLSRSYLPIKVISWQRAMSKVAAGSVVVLHNYEDRVIRHGMGKEVPMPCVVAQKRSSHRHVRKYMPTKENVYYRDGGRCQYCMERIPMYASTRDHVIPYSKGGPSSWENLVLACFACNQKKAAATPAQAGMVLRKIPTKPSILPAKWMLADKSGIPDAWKMYIVELMEDHHYNVHNKNPVDGG